MPTRKYLRKAQRIPKPTEIKMRAVLIDPHLERIEAVETSGSLDEIYRLTQCNCIDGVRVSEKDYMFVDDEGLFRDGQRFFTIDDYPQPIAGRGLIFGITNSGDNAPCLLSLGILRQCVRFLPKNMRFAGMRTSEGRTNHPVLGDNVLSISHTPEFVMVEDDDASAPVPSDEGGLRDNRESSSREDRSDSGSRTDDKKE